MKAQIGKMGPNISVGREGLKQEEQTPRPTPEGKSRIKIGKETGSEK